MHFLATFPKLASSSSSMPMNKNEECVSILSDSEDEFDKILYGKRKKEPAMKPAPKPKTNLAPNNSGSESDSKENGDISLSLKHLHPMSDSGSDDEQPTR